MLKTPFEKIFISKLIKSSQVDSTYSRKDFQAYTEMQPQDFKERIIKDFDFIKKYMIESILNDKEIEQRMNAKRMIEFGKKNDCSKTRNDQSLDNQTNTSGNERVEPMAEVPYTAKYYMFAIDTKHSEQPESISNTCVVEKVDSNAILDSPDMCDNDIQIDQNAKACDDERVALANLIANLKLEIDENKKIQKQIHH
uniref:Uncharacterized protein n=1 Tax=Tanacetum cinerariifolium TaxID=118510 RepID=A0A6L2KYP9_TANCI|nr:hypothetical protein [Tanacetum cinerariifolium]